MPLRRFRRESKNAPANCPCFRPWRRLLRLERFSEALPVLKQLIERKPDDPELWVKLGLVWVELRDPGRATKALLHSLKLDAENSAAKLLLSKVLVGCAAAHEAESLLIEAAKTDDRAFSVLGNVYKDLGYMDLALDCYARSLIHHPSHPEQSNFLYTLLYDPAHDHQEVAEEHRNWGRTYADPLRPAKISFDRDRDPNRPLRIGYVSGHYWDHAVSLFSLPMIQAHDPDAFQLYLYYSERNAIGRRMPSALMPLDGTKSRKSPTLRWRDSSRMIGSIF